MSADSAPPRGGDECLRCGGPPWRVLMAEVLALRARVARYEAAAADALGALAALHGPMADVPRDCRPALPSRVDDVLEAVSARYGVSVGGILGRRRSASIARARNAAYAALREVGLSWVEVGSVFGRDHTTAMDGAMRHVAGTRRPHGGPRQIDSPE